LVDDNQVVEGTEQQAIIDTGLAAASLVLDVMDVTGGRWLRAASLRLTMPVRKLRRPSAIWYAAPHRRSPFAAIMTAYGPAIARVALSIKQTGRGHAIAAIEFAQYRCVIVN
jgi:hypothetical protein